ncbi:SHOCT domain-containing protein [Micromonospora sp. NPDC005806]|uniref:SHOCT domain-containing protein n=1 Tax=Micromonospora sp. NPDC005806 TaxID=3364234 RepID=UPI0036909DDD
MMGGWWLLNALFSLVILGLIIGGVILLVRRLDRGPSGQPAPVASAEAILADRYARGEIDEREYRQRLGTLRGHS